MPVLRLGLLLLLSGTCIGWSDPPQKSPKEALQAFNDLIGPWRGSGVPEGSREKRQKGFWIESLDWSWKFDKSEPRLVVGFEKGKYYAKGELRYLAKDDQYELSLETVDKASQTFKGSLKDKVLTLQRVDQSSGETQRLVLTLLHSNRYLYRYEVKGADRPLFTRVYQVGATKEGVPFAAGASGPECVVSGGQGTIAVIHKGQTYYVCCSGCREVFKEEPEKYIQEYNAKKKAEKK